MNRAVVLILVGAVFFTFPVHGEPKSKKARSGAVPTAITHLTPRLHEFQGDEVILVLKTLARAAGVTIIISDQVTGTVTARIEDKTPLQALQIIAESTGLIVEDREGVFYIRPENPLPPVAVSKKSEGPEQFEETIQQYITAISRQVQVAAKDPNITDAFAEYYWNLFSALRKKGFTEQQAILIMSQATVPIDIPGK